MIKYNKMKVNFLLLFFSWLFTSCNGQITESIPVTITKNHKDSISLKAEKKQEYKNSMHEKDNKGKQK